MPSLFTPFLRGMAAACGAFKKSPYSNRNVAADTLTPRKARSPLSTRLSACAARRARARVGTRRRLLGVGLGLPLTTDFTRATALHHLADPRGADAFAIEQFFQRGLARIHIAREQRRGTCALHLAAHALAQFGVGLQLQRPGAGLAFHLRLPTPEQMALLHLGGAGAIAGAMAGF